MSASLSTEARDGAFLEAFRELFDAELAYVVRVLRRLGVRPSDLEDVAQDVFVSVYRRFREYDRGAPARPWLFSFALRASANYRRLARHRREVHTEGEPATDATSPEDATSEARARALVLRALDRLPDEQRTVFVMHDIEGFCAPEIASEVEAPLNTVYSRLRLARAAFASAVADLRPPEEK